MAEISPLDLPMAIMRRGLHVVTPVSFYCSTEEHQLCPEYFTALDLMPQIYSHSPVSEQKAITKRLIDEHNDKVALLMWWHAYSTGHELIAKAAAESGRIAVSKSLGWEESGESFMDKTMEPVLNAPDDKEEAEQVRMFLEEWSSEAESLLHEAAAKGKDGVIRKLLAANISPASETRTYLSTLHAACFQGHLESAKTLVEVGGLDVNRRDDFGGTPLMRAAAAGHIDIVHWLLQHGADVALKTYPDSQNKMAGELDAVTLAAYGGHLEMVKFLFDADAVPIRKAIGSAATGGSEECFDLLLGEGEYPIHSDFADDWKGAKLTAEQREDLVAALKYSGSAASPSLISKILAYFAPLDAPGQPQRTKVGAEVEDAVFHALASAAEKDFALSFKVLADFLLHTIEPIEPEGSETNLPWATRVREHLSDILVFCGGENSPQVITLLKGDYGIDINALHSETKTTALYQAARFGHADLIRMLVAHGADIHLGNGKFANGPTALWKAVDGGHEPAVRALLELGGPIANKEVVTPATKTVYLLSLSGYRAPVVFATEHGLAWNYLHEHPLNEDAMNVHWEYVCLEYPDGLWFLDEVVPRKSDEELADERELKERPEGWQGRDGGIPPPDMEEQKDESEGVEKNESEKGEKNESEKGEKNESEKREKNESEGGEKEEL